MAHENDLLEPGIAFPLVQKLLRLNQAPPAAPSVEVILLSRNSADTGSAHFQFDRTLQIGYFARGVHQRRIHVAVRAFVRRESVSLGESGKRGARALPLAWLRRRSCHRRPHLQYRTNCASPSMAMRSYLAMNPSAYRHEQGIEAFHRNEVENVDTPLSGGPFRGFLAALHRLQIAFPEGESRRSAPHWSRRAQPRRTSA